MLIFLIKGSLMKAKSVKAVKKTTNTKSKKTVKKHHSVVAKHKPTKTGGSSLIRTNVNMDKGLHSKAKQVAAKMNISLNKLINTAIKEHLK
jgi:predicted HicB family RNase H-like nuclease